MGKFSKLNLTFIRGWRQGKLNSCLNLEHRILCWQIARGVQNVPDSSLQYANDNALLLAKVLWHNFSLASLQLVSVDYWFLILTKCSAAVFKGSIACYILLLNVLVCIYLGGTCSTWVTAQIKERLSSRCALPSVLLVNGVDARSTFVINNCILLS